MRTEKRTEGQIRVCYPAQVIQMQEQTGHGDKTESTDPCICRNLKHKSEENMDGFIQGTQKTSSL